MNQIQQTSIAAERASFRKPSPAIKLVLITAFVYGIPLYLISMISFSRNLYGGAPHSLVWSLISGGDFSLTSLGLISDLLLLYCAYILFIRRPKDIASERAVLIWEGIKKISSTIFVDFLKKPFGLSHEEKVSLLFYCVKIFFTPLMVKFFISNSIGFLDLLRDFALTSGGAALTAENLLRFYYPLGLKGLLVVDTLIFSFGYLFESKKLDNVVRSVEPTAFGWFIALVCYPPVNQITAKYLGWYSSDFTRFQIPSLTLFFGGLSLALFAIYVWASWALGAKASNLTNRGIVSSGPYRYVRHPSYVSKNLAWWLMGIPFIQSKGLIAVASLAVWSFIYFLRALTEERHLMKDPEYVEYMKRTRFMFIPGVF